MNSSVDLVTRACQGDQEAFRLIFERYSRPVISFIYDQIGDRDLAEELTQETFVRAYRSLKSLREETKLSTWLFGIAKNVARESLRAKIRKKQELDLDDKESPERVAAEICRIVRRVYGVRKAEVSSMIERERVDRDAS